MLAPAREKRVSPARGRGELRGGEENGEAAAGSFSSAGRRRAARVLLLEAR